MLIDVLSTPAEFETLRPADLPGAGVVVFDVLRATSTVAAALAAGAASVLPVRTIEEALAVERARPGVLLAGERGGLRISAAQTGGRDFDLGNSPREFTADRVAGRTVVMTTTNGTRALHAARGADFVFAAALVNLGAVVAEIRRRRTNRLLVLCSGTGEAAAYEDSMAAGDLCDRLGEGAGVTLSDAGRLARGAWRRTAADFAAELRHAANARRLAGIPELAPDLDWCLRRDVLDNVPAMDADGELRCR